MENFLGVATIVTIISNLIQYQYNECDGFIDYFLDEYGWINILACVGGFAILAGFIFWSWKLVANSSFYYLCSNNNFLNFMSYK